MELAEPVPHCERKNLCGLLYALLFMLFLITVLGESFLKIVRAMS